MLKKITLQNLLSLKDTTLEHSRQMLGSLNAERVNQASKNCQRLFHHLHSLLEA